MPQSWKCDCIVLHGKRTFQAWVSFEMGRLSGLLVGPLGEEWGRRAGGQSDGERDLINYAGFKDGGRGYEPGCGQLLGGWKRQRKWILRVSRKEHSLLGVSWFAHRVADLLWLPKVWDNKFVLFQVIKVIICYSSNKILIQVENKYYSIYNLP